MLENQYWFSPPEDVRRGMLRLYVQDVFGSVKISVISVISVIRGEDFGSQTQGPSSLLVR
jgi:hypothetical protein